jgi:hypothetical protein
MYFSLYSFEKQTLLPLENRHLLADSVDKVSGIAGIDANVSFR